MTSVNHATQPALARRLPLLLITLYGVGTILGAGIYVLPGKVAGESALYTPHAFLLAAIVVAFSARAYAKLSRRFPVSAGEAAYVQEILHWPKLATAVGWAVMFTGIVSAATISRGFAGYVEPYVPLPSDLSVALLVCLLTVVAMWGVAEAVSVAAVFTVVEVAGIGLVIYFAAPEMAAYVQRTPEVISVPPVAMWPAIGFGAFLAFYAYIGFEDIVNMGEEVKNPRFNLPSAIYLSLIITSLLYFITALSFMTLLPFDVFVGSEAPFAEVAREQPGLSLGLITLISIVAITNGALVQIIMGSRVLYGMASRGLAPGKFFQVWAKTHTPVLATFAVGSVVLLFALLLPLTTLAKITSTIVLSVFICVNLSLLVLEWRERRQMRNTAVRFARLSVTGVGIVTCVGFLVLQLFNPA